MQKIAITFIKDGKLRVITSTVDDSAIDEIIALTEKRTVV